MHGFYVRCCVTGTAVPLRFAGKAGLARTGKGPVAELPDNAVRAKAGRPRTGKGLAAELPDGPAVIGSARR